MLNSDFGVSFFKIDVFDMDVGRFLEDVSILGDWEKDFFINFEENLFNFDFDDKVLNDIFVFFKGKEVLNDLMKFLKGKVILNFFKGKLLKNKLKLLDIFEYVKFRRINSFGFNISLNVLSFCDLNKMFVILGLYNVDFRSVLKMLRRKFIMVFSGKED